ncbi:MAG: hypothetical protein B6240_08235 [Desulfobacteraceae bacterium 4572_87]|nr:MAG: hypothetical protein B6240_08235 [Desulfobacteraceae bacterium 4572_87]
MSHKTDTHETDSVDEAVPEFMAGMVDDLEYIPRDERLGRAGKEEKPATGSLEAGLVRIEKRLEALETKFALMERSMRSDHSKKKGRPTSKPGTAYHIVRPGDNLSTIASKYGITVDRLCRLNQLTVDKPIKPDQKLLVSRN